MPMVFAFPLPNLSCVLDSGLVRHCVRVKGFLVRMGGSELNERPAESWMEGCYHEANGHKAD